MEIKRNTFYFTKIEKNRIKKLIDSKYGKISTPIDYDTTGGDFDIGIEGDFYIKTGEMISGSTLERLVGLTGKENSGVRKGTINTVIKYLDFKGFRQLERYLEHSIQHPCSNLKEFDFNTVFKNHLIKIEFGANKALKTRYLNANKFEVLQSINSKILEGDKIELLQLEVSEELICKNVFRNLNKKTVELGKYKSGENNKVVNISFTK